MHLLLGYRCVDQVYITDFLAVELLCAGSVAVCSARSPRTTAESARAEYSQLTNAFSGVFN